MSARESTIFTDKRKFLKRYQEVRDKGYRREDITQMTMEQYGGFYLPAKVLEAAFDPASDDLNPVAVVAFCKAFDIPVDDKGKLTDFERKDKFLRLYHSVLKQQELKGTEVLKMINGYCSIPVGTFNDAVSQCKFNLNAIVVIAFCKTFGYDIDLIFREEPDRQKNLPLPIQSGGDTVDTRLPNGFEGRFYGYFFNSTPDYAQHGKLDQFTLDIGSHGITMTLRHFALDNANQYKPREIAMRGRIIHNRGGGSPSGILAIAFNSEDDAKFCALAYNKLQLNGPLHFRKGAMLIQSRGGGEPMPVMQSFVFTDKKIDLDIPFNRTVLQGALALTGDAVLLKKDDLEAFLDTEALREYFRREPFEGAVRQYIELDEVNMRRLKVRDKDELYRILLQIKADAAAPRLFSFPNTGTDRSWRCIAALGEEQEPWRQEDSPQTEQ